MSHRSALTFQGTLSLVIDREGFALISNALASGCAEGVGFEPTNDTGPDLKPGAFDRLSHPCVNWSGRLESFNDTLFLAAIASIILLIMSQKMLSEYGLNIYCWLNQSPS